MLLSTCAVLSMPPKRIISPADKQPGISGAGGMTSSDFFLPFFHTLALPKSTPVASYYSYVQSLPIGVIRRIWLEFPAGCAGLAGVQIWRGVRQIFPLPDGYWLKSNGSVLNFAFSHEIDREPYSVEFRGYNLDDTFPHNIWVGIEMSGPKSALSDKAQSFLSLL